MEKSRDYYISIINKLYKLANDPACFEAEREQALAKIAELLVENHINEQELGVKSKTTHTAVFFQTPISLPWANHLCEMIAFFYQTFCLSLQNPQTKQFLGVTLVGEPLSIESTQKVLEILFPQFDKLIANYCTDVVKFVPTSPFTDPIVVKVEDKVAVMSFATGLIQGLRNRLITAMFSGSYTSSRELVSIALVDVNKTNQDYIKDNFGQSAISNLGPDIVLDEELYLKGLAQSECLTYT